MVRSSTPSPNRSVGHICSESSSQRNTGQLKGRSHSTKNDQENGERRVCQNVWRLWLLRRLKQVLPFRQLMMNVIKQRKWIVTGAFIACLVVLLFYPFETTVVPEWKLRVVDQTGQPLRGNRVRESWYHYALGTQSLEEELLSAGDGYVQFPRRAIRTNLITWAVKFLMRVPNVHSSYGPSASVYYMGDYPLVSDEPWYEPGRPLAKEIVVRRP